MTLDIQQLISDSSRTVLMLNDYTNNNRNKEDNKLKNKIK